MKKGLEARVLGRVQGVGFRYFVVGRARSLDLCGFVCNRADGSVEVRAEGEEKQLEDLLLALRQGPAGSRVDQCEVVWRPYTKCCDTFEVTY